MVMILPPSFFGCPGTLPRSFSRSTRGQRRQRSRWAGGGDAVAKEVTDSILWIPLNLPVEVRLRARATMQAVCAARAGVAPLTHRGRRLHCLGRKIDTPEIPVAARSPGTLRGSRAGMGGQPGTRTEGGGTTGEPGQWHTGGLPRRIRPSPGEVASGIRAVRARWRHGLAESHPPAPRSVSAT